MTPHRLLVVVTTLLLVAGCATTRAPGPQDSISPEYFREIKALRPEGYGLTNYGLASGCRVGTCLAAQRLYHTRFLAIREKYHVPESPLAAALTAPLLPYAEALAARVDGGEITPAHAEEMIQAMRATIMAEWARLTAGQAPSTPIVALPPPLPPRPLSCITTYIGAMPITRCY